MKVKFQISSDTSPGRIYFQQMDWPKDVPLPRNGELIEVDNLILLVECVVWTIEDDEDPNDEDFRGIWNNPQAILMTVSTDKRFGHLERAATLGWIKESEPS